jgi:hypothetical protein
MARSAFNEYSSISSSPPMFLEDINEDESWKDFCEEVFHALSYPSSALYLYNKGTKNLVKSHEGHWQRRALTIHVDETCLRSMEEVRSQSSRATRRVRDAVRLIWWEYECHCFHCDAINSISLYCLRRVAFYFIMVWETTSISPVPLLPRLRGRSVTNWRQIRISCISASFSMDRFVISGGYYHGSVEAVIKPIVR